MLENMKLGASRGDTFVEDILCPEVDLSSDSEDLPNLFNEKSEIESSTKKPFGSYIEHQLASVKLQGEVTGLPNPYYSLELMEVMKKWLKTLPIWTNIMRGNIQTTLLIYSHVYRRRQAILELDKTWC